MLQALASIAFVAILGSALIAGSLANANVAAHQLETRGIRFGLERGTNDAVAFARRFVAARGAATAWPVTSVADETEPLCASGVSPCTASLEVYFRVAADSAAEATGPDAAANVQRALNENRLSAVVTATVRDRAGFVRGGGTRLVTIRLFDAWPYAVLTGVRDATTMAGAANAAEGDSAGTTSGTSAPPTPDPAHPASDVDTTIHVTMTCANSAENGDPDPFADDNSPGNDGTPWGVHGHGYEAPCAPAYALSPTPPVPSDAPPRAANVYDVGSFATIRWSSATGGSSTWAP